MKQGQGWLSGGMLAGLWLLSKAVGDITAQGRGYLFQLFCNTWNLLSGPHLNLVHLSGWTLARGGVDGQS